MLILLLEAATKTDGRPLGAHRLEFRRRYRPNTATTLRLPLGFARKHSDRPFGAHDGPLQEGGGQQTSSDRPDASTPMWNGLFLLVKATRLPRGDQDRRAITPSPNEIRVCLRRLTRA